MLPPTHILYGAIFSLIVYLLFPFLGWNVLIIFGASFLFDIDHFLPYIFRQKSFNPIKSYKFFEKMDKNSKERACNYLCLFHTVEFLILLIILMIILPNFYSDIILLLLTGFLFHLLLDLIYEYSRKDFKPYSFILWLIKRGKKDKDKTKRGKKMKI